MWQQDTSVFLYQNWSIFDSLVPSITFQTVVVLCSSCSTLSRAKKGRAPYTWQPFMDASHALRSSSKTVTRTRADLPAQAFLSSSLVCDSLFLPRSPPGGEIDCVDKYGNTPLHVAAKYGHELLISTLMTNGADTARYQTDRVIRYWRMKIFVLIKCWLKISWYEPSCRALTSWSLSFGFPRRGIHGMFPLHLAVLYGFSDCCRKLLSSGLSPNTCTLSDFCIPVCAALDMAVTTLCLFTPLQVSCIV